MEPFKGVANTLFVPLVARIAVSKEFPSYFYHPGKSTMPDQLDQTWVNCLNLFGVEYNA